MTVKFNSNEIMNKVRAGAMRGLVRGTEMVRNEALRLILNTPKTGRLYGHHQASAPGEAPASDTGRLVNSITTSYDMQKLVGTVKANTAYAEALEMGTARMEPRPFMRPSLANTRDAVERAVAQEVEAELRR